MIRPARALMPLVAALALLSIAAPAVAQSTTRVRLDNALLVLIRENPVAPVAV